ncbi:FkbM family methyltransferase [Alienimonas sp. DA493]|uniref:FkbM family methyltransferase n=1 Tax=Alienimonas sp. DA493 TaxID=3373605 RepID=UPI003754C18D
MSANVPTGPIRRLRALAKRAAMAVGLKPDSGLRIARFLETYSAAVTARGPLRFVQIGANDGVRNDPLYPLIERGGWEGVLVEPVPALFERLRRTHRDRPELTLLNAAVAPEAGSRPFYHLPESEGLPIWANGLGSFLKESLLTHADKIPDVADRIERIEVPCVTYRTICEERGWERVDLVHSDTEGFDFEIVQSLDYDRFPPGLLLFEWVHLNGADRAACRRFLEDRGYEPLAGHWDAVALRDPDAAAPDVRAAWDRLRAGLARYNRAAPAA